MPATPGYVRSGNETATPYLVTDDADGLIGFLVDAFEGTLEYRHDRDDGAVGNAQVRIGGSLVMLSQSADGWPEWPSRVYLFVPDVDAAFVRAVALGARALMEPIDEPYGDRAAGVEDPFGNQWWIATALDAVSG